MSDNTTELNKRIMESTGRRPRMRHKIPIPDPRGTKVVDESDTNAGVKLLDTLTEIMRKVHVSKKCKIPDSDRTLALPNYPQDTADKGNDAGKNVDFANLLVESFEFGRIAKTLYVRRDGIFAPLLENDFDLLLRMAALSNNLPGELRKSISSYRSSELYAWLLAHPSVKELPDLPDKRYVAVLNGILDLKKKKLLQVEDFSGEKELPVLFNRINAEYIDYDEEEWNDSASYRYLKRLADPDCREKCVDAMLYMNGKIFSNDRSGKNLYSMYGDSGNGKSVYGAFLQAIVGSGNYGNLSLKDLTLQFSMINLRHALVNISTDEDTEAWNSATASLVKRITGHDTLQVDVKYERMQQFRPYCILLCMGNAEPKYSKTLDAGGAISKRLFLIPTGPTVDSPDEELLEKKLLPEKNLFFSKSMNYFMENEHPQKIVDVEEVIFPDISPKELHNRWVSDCVEITNGNEELLVEELWQNYCHYVETVPGASRMKRRSFEMACAVKLARNRSKSRFQNRSCYVGLQLVEKNFSPHSSGFGGW